jgi:hypothetical protein
LVEPVVQVAVTHAPAEHDWVALQVALSAKVLFEQL